MESLTSNWQGFIYTALSQLLFGLPLITVYIVGIVLSFTKSQKYPRVSFLSGLGFGILLVLSVLSIILALLPLYLSSQRYSMQNIGYILAASSIITTIISAVATALLLRAIWKDRG